MANPAPLAALSLASLLALGGPAGAAPGLPVETTMDHVGVRVADIDRSIKFYTDNFGFHLVRRADYTLAGRQVELKDADLTAAFIRLPGSSAIELIQFRKPLPGAAGQAAAPGVFHLGLYIKDVRAAHRRLSAAGVAFTSEPRLRDGSYTASLQDPDGVTLELIESAAVIPAK